VERGVEGLARGVVALIHVVVPNWNGAEHLPACIRSLAAQDAAELEIVVVDNGSVDDSMAVLAELGAEIAPVPLTVLRNDRNLGFAGGVNRGIRHALAARADAIALFNNDAVADRRWLSSLRGVLAAEPAVAIVTGRLLMGDGATVDSTGDFYTVWGLAFPRDRDQPADPVRPSGEVFGASGGASLFRSSLFADVGLFDEEFFAYFEDVDLSFRARLAGHGVRYCADAVAYHDQGATSRTVSGFLTRQFFRNLPLLLAKNVPARLLPAVVPRFLLVYSLMVVYQFRRGQGLAALGGVAQSFALVARCLPRRRAIQRARRVDASVVRGLLWPGLPPGMRVLRGTRDRLRPALRLRRHRRP
jgi:GT2 family glycosyltransferase